MFFRIGFFVSFSSTLLPMQWQDMVVLFSWLPVQPSMTADNIIFFFFQTSLWAASGLQGWKRWLPKVFFYQQNIDALVSLIYLTVYVIIKPLHFPLLRLFGICSKMELLICLGKSHIFFKIMLTISKWRVEAFRNICVYLYIPALLS